MEYGALELAYSLPFVEAIESNTEFRTWILSRTPLVDVATNCRLLKDEMTAKRPKAKYYWRSFFTEKCRCPGCSGRETDILSVFESEESRFSLHTEVKQPTDEFKKDGVQAQAYPIRATCWTTPGNGPASLVNHQRAATALLCSSKQLLRFQPYLEHFDTIITFEEISDKFPGIYSAELLAA